MRIFERARYAVAIAAATLACGGPDDLADRGPEAGWPVYGADAAGTRHSPAREITPENVHRLEVAWTYNTGDVLQPGEALAPSTFQSTPILFDGRLLLCTPFNRVIALDPRDGKELWSYDPEADLDGIYTLNCRGVSGWVDSRANPDAVCAKRVFTGTLDARLIALDAATGEPCVGFGQGGTVDLKQGVGETQPGEYGVTSPPVVIGDRIVTGTMVLDNRRTDSPGGVVRAYSARTGELLWAWDPIPPEQAALRQTGEAYVRGTTNAWSVLSADAERNLVFVPTGNTSPDYYGGHRDGLDFYSSSVVALDADSGAVVWHYQTVHHDVWDYDVGSQPVLFDFERAEGGTTPGLLAGTKMGHLFFLDRVTGAPLLPVEERPVPQAGRVPEEVLSPTQPFPVRPPPLHPPALTPDDAFGFTFWDRGKCREAIAALRSDGIFTPPSTQGTVQYPGMVGGMNWGSLSVDSGRRLAVVNVQRVATKIRLVPRADFEAAFPQGAPKYGFEPQAGTPYALERLPLLSPLGAPCNPPPWGTLAAVDLQTGEVAWEVPLGTARDLAPWPVWWWLGDIGVPNLGGPITTASGLTFIGATTDAYLRAFATETGEELWRHRLPTSAQSTPMTYRLADGRQLVVVAAGGHMLLGTAPGDAVVAFALPD